MLLRFFPILVIIHSLASKPIVVRNISDCSITEDGILHYSGKHSFTKFEHECLPWEDFQILHGNIINEPNFLHDASIKAAKNYCRNPNMNVNGPWCFVDNEEVVTMEQCDVCQSLEKQTTLPTDIDVIDETTMENVKPGFFESLGDDIKRYASYIREKFWQVIEHIRGKFQQLGSKIASYFKR